EGTVRNENGDYSGFFAINPHVAALLLPASPAERSPLALRPQALLHPHPLRAEFCLQECLQSSS
ncbi:MAG: hypothetical protein WCB46_12450, partial [Methanoregula sp.]